jgi:hypothetical protein
LLSNFLWKDPIFVWLKEIANSLGTMAVHSFQWNGPSQPYEKSLKKMPSIIHWPHCDFV